MLSGFDASSVFFSSLSPGVHDRVCRLLFKWPAGNSVTVIPSKNSAPFHSTSGGCSCRQTRPYRDRSLRSPNLRCRPVVHSIRNRFAHSVGKVVDVYRFRLALWLPLLTRILEFSHQFLLFRVHRDDRLPLPMKGPHLAVDILEMSIPVRVRRAFAGLAVGLQAIAAPLQQHERRCDPRRGDSVASILRPIWPVLLQVQRNGDTGSPRVAGSIRRSSASSKPGSV